MADGLTPYQRGDGDGELVRFGPIRRTRSLLPFEEELCRTLGISEEEYEWYRDQVANKAYVRPAEYELVPDVRNEPAVVSILISLAIGIATTAIGMLLAPKPPEQQGEQTSRQLGSRQGRSRFAPTYGFDGVADLAQFGDAVPVVWTRFTGNTGGVVLEPKMVWARAFSWGLGQSIKMLYVLGEEGISAPEFKGMWAGNNRITVAGDQSYAVFYRSGTGKPSGLIAGTKGGPASGDPTNRYFPDFSQCFTPSNNLVFGVSNGIPNGTFYRVNWRVVSVLDSAEGKGKQNANSERKKICGYGRGQRPGMPGTGLNYPRRQGFVNSNTFLLSGNRIPPNLWKNGVKMDDVNSYLDSECEAADDALQIGETFMCGGQILTVTGRSEPIWLSKQDRTQGDARDVKVKLSGTETVYPLDYATCEREGLSNNTFIERDGKFFGGATRGYGLGHFPLLRYSSAEFSNSRPVNVTEIGIRAQVWGQFAGLCNFSNIPDPEQLERYDSSDTQVQSGTMNTYFKRTSCFTIHTRDKGSTTWQTNHSLVLAVQGSTAQDQFHYLTIEHGSCRELEYRLTPLNSAIIARLSDSAPVHVLRGGQGQFSVGLSNGTTLKSSGMVVSVGEILPNKLMYDDPMEGDYEDEEEKQSGQPREVKWAGAQASNDTIDGIRHAWMYEVFGNAASYPLGTYKQAVVMFKADKDGKTKKVAVFLQSKTYTQYVDSVKGNRTVWSRFDDPTNGGDFGLWDNENVKRKWVSYKAEVLDLKDNASLEVRQNIASDHEYTLPEQGSSTARLTYWDSKPRMSNGVRIDPVTNPWHEKYLSNKGSNRKYRVDAVFQVKGAEKNPLGGTRRFEEITQVAEVSYYGDLIRRSCDQGPEFRITYVNEVRLGERGSFQGLTTMGVSLKSSRNYSAADQLRVFIKSGVSGSNSFPKLVRYMLENSSLKGHLNSSMIDYGSFDAADAFCNANGLFFDGVVADRTNLRSFIVETAPFFLLTLSISNGKIALLPGIPTGSATQLYTAGNIVAGSLKVNFVDISQRRDFQAVMTYRKNRTNELPRVETLRAYWNGNAPMEQFDMTSFCTSRVHAEKVARYFLALRRLITKTVEFQTYPDQARLQPGHFITIAVDEVMVGRTASGFVAQDLKVNPLVELADGTYPVTYWREGMEEVGETDLQVVRGRTSNSDLAGALFSIHERSIRATNYLVDEVELGEDGLVNVRATEFPADIASITMGGGGVQLRPATESDC